MDRRLESCTLDWLYNERKRSHSVPLPSLKGDVRQHPQPISISPFTPNPEEEAGGPLPLETRLAPPSGPRLPCWVAYVWVKPLQDVWKQLGRLHGVREAWAEISRAQQPIFEPQRKPAQHPESKLIIFTIYYLQLLQSIRSVLFTGLVVVQHDLRVVRREDLVALDAVLIVLLLVGVYVYHLTVSFVSKE